MDDSRTTSRDNDEGRRTSERAEGAKPPDRDNAEAAASRRWRRFVLLAVFGVIVLAAAGIYGWYYVTVGRYIASTDDAYTEADIIAISPQVSGYISQLPVTDNQLVKQGQLLARIDDRTYRAAVDQAAAAVASAKAQIANVAAQMALQRSQITEAEAGVATAEASLKLAQDTDLRYARLHRSGIASEQAAQQADTSSQTQSAALRRAQASLNAANQQMAVLSTQKEVATAGLQRSEAALESAQINLGYTTLVAPADGAVGNRAARVGLYVQPGEQLMFIVPMRRDIYVVANFKETEIGKMFRGQHVRISVDALPNLKLAGRVDSLAPGSGSQFSLLPPENATGNFTKIVQRVPVKILLDPGNASLDQLRPGLSVEASVDTRTTPPGPAMTLVRQGP
jgi:membrane fusion protein, multidrug efflux system